MHQATSQRHDLIAPPEPRRASAYTAGLLALAAWYCLLSLFTFLMFQITAQYWPIRDDVAFLRIKAEYLDIWPWKIAFFIHVFTSLFALAAGFTQFAPGLLRKWPVGHRWVGRIYVADVVLVTGPASLIMAFFANGGITSRAAFTVLSALWISTTAIAYRAIRRRRWKEHRDWMMRSYALTLSAITLRLWKLGLVWMFHPNPMDVYRVVAWLGFVPNLLLAEWLIRRGSKASLRKLSARSVSDMAAAGKTSSHR
ncbi:MAG: DUF2306 domain-containing protein [Verrucomicrobia bacterium]|nr:DUF2306 domain-containing protein [Verrucomicrobiota bacterium]